MSKIGSTTSSAVSASASNPVSRETCVGFDQPRVGLERRHGRRFDVIVIGGGHAGCGGGCGIGAAWCAHGSCSPTRFATIGEMSCNPAIGGLGKGHLVREIDALDGLMGRVADRAGIQFRLLNRSQGPGGARAPGPGRSQALPRGDAGGDSRSRITSRLLKAAGRGFAACKNGAVRRSHDRGWPKHFSLAAVVLTTGTFLNGLIHHWREKDSGGPRW